MTDHQAIHFDPDSDAASSADFPLNGRTSASDLSGNSLASFRLLAAERDAALSQNFDLTRLWLELCRGTWRFRDTFPTENRYIALIEEPSVRFPQPLKACKLSVLKRVLLGEAPKAVAIELRMGLSSVAAAIQDCLLGMGIPGRLSQASVLLTMAAYAAHCPESSPTLGRLTRVEIDGEGYWVVSVVRPDLSFPVSLSHAEAAVVRELVAGRSHAQISSLRSTSPRTVANQLATVFRKLGVSGRGAVVHRLIQHSLAHH
ncbi:MAG TPA: LuxR C-terminal-related transcriptional regulator [Polyangiaceae bacterium]|nr:LuxR C-terminal-related transcriptional regulator [Polyangiaceae bacterium]